ncbi:EF-hand domain-containing protein [Bradyrhizobium sp. STM 3809]|uniref:EF-hand domain-containing protein n=1 Tax=Bradyrhizobium sp. STM 3809 TaxID=551936 RepID=UPI000696E291|nr:EF-hand domain-containing protein [Bradyrhizobium sp. STM 3809]
MSIDLSGVSAASGSSQVWSGASARAPASQKMTNLFDQIDTSGSGSITQSQFEQAFQTRNPPKDFKAAGADAIWSQLDPSNTGSVSKQDFVSSMTTLMKQMRTHHQSESTMQSSAQSVYQTISSSRATLQGLIISSQVDVTA